MSDMSFMQNYGEYDHVDRTQRKFALSAWERTFSLTEDDFLKEQAKCRRLCPNHHQQHSHNQRRDEAKVYSQKPNAQYGRAAYARGLAHNNMRKR